MSEDEKKKGPFDRTATELLEDNYGPYIAGVGIGGTVRERDGNVIKHVDLREASFLMHPRGSRGDLTAALAEMVYNRVPAGVRVEGLVLTTRGGWRRWVLKFAMWLIRKSGHEVIENVRE
jgi:hypothetical protein